MCKKKSHDLIKDCILLMLEKGLMGWDWERNEIMYHTSMCSSKFYRFLQGRSTILLTSNCFLFFFFFFFCWSVRSKEDLVLSPIRAFPIIKPPNLFKWKSTFKVYLTAWYSQWYFLISRVMEVCVELWHSVWLYWSRPMVQKKVMNSNVLSSPQQSLLLCLPLLSR